MRAKLWCNLMRKATGVEQGNVFAIILLAVVLFAALVFVISRGFDTGTTRMTSTQARNFATDIVTYAASVERSVGYIIQNGVSEEDISFENGVVSGYDHTPAAASNAKVFGSSTGGGLSFKSPLENQSSSATNKWLFTGGIVVTDQESNSLSDLIMTLPVGYDVCAEINRQLGVSIDLTADQGSVTGAKFTGTYTDNGTIVIAPGAGITSGCFKGLVTDGGQTGPYTFFKILIAR